MIDVVPMKNRSNSYPLTKHLLIRIGDGRSVRLFVRFLRKPEVIQSALLRDGWGLEPAEDDSVTARHPLVLNEAAARRRLQDLGLLTASSISIRFDRLGGSQHPRPPVYAERT